MKQKILALLMVGVFSFTALTGCGGGDSSSDSSSTSTETTANTSTDTASDTSADDTAADDTSTDDAAADDTAADDAAADDAEEGSVWDNFDTFYGGITDDENTYILCAFGQEGTLGAIVFFNSETLENGSWVGETTTDGDMMTVSDESNGTTLQLGIEEADGGYLLDMGDIGSAAVGSMEKSAWVEAVEAVDAGTAPQF